MLEVHILNVDLGESIILHTELADKSYYSIIDCKKVGTKTPTVEFLKKHDIKDLCSIFLTHFHHDHCSGFPDLYEYLKQNNGTLDYYISPYLPDEIKLRKQIVSLIFNKAMKPGIDNILRAIDDLIKLPSSIHEDKKAKTIRMNYEHNRTSSAWRSDIHPGLCIAPVSPDPVQALNYIKSAIKSPNLYSNLMNATSHTFLIKYENSFGGHIGLFTGDLENKENWKKAKNTCLEITQNAIRNNIRILKIAHHGSAQSVMETCLKEMIKPETQFLASISCPPGSSNHPSKRTLTFLKDNFLRCSIACTNISAYCQNLSSEDILKSFELSEDEEIFSEYAAKDKTISHIDITGECVGDHSLTITEKDCQYTSSTGKSCLLINDKA